MNSAGSILVVEDNYEMQDLLKLLLEQAGYSVTSTTMGEEALVLLKANKDFSLILLDMTLADMSAYLFLEKKSQDGLGQEVPIVLCSASPDIVQMKLPEGVVGVIPKPFQIKELLKTIEKFKRCIVPNVRSDFSQMGA